MSTLTITKTYVDGDPLTESMLDNIKDDVETFVNTTGLGSDNIADSAITTDKIATSAVTTAKLASSAVTTAKIADGNVTKAKIEALGQQTSSSCGSSATVTGTTYTDITNLSVSITTTGRPVIGILISADGSNPSQIYTTRSNSGTTLSVFIKLKRDSTDVAIHEAKMTFASSSSSITYGVLPGSVYFYDAPAAGTYTYKIQAKAGGSTETVNFEYLKLMVYEL